MTDNLIMTKKEQEEKRARLQKHFNIILIRGILIVLIVSLFGMLFWIYNSMESKEIAISYVGYVGCLNKVLTNKTIENYTVYVFDSTPEVNMTELTTNQGKLLIRFDRNVTDSTRCLMIGTIYNETEFLQKWGHYDTYEVDYDTFTILPETSNAVKSSYSQITEMKLK